MRRVASAAAGLAVLIAFTWAGMSLSHRLLSPLGVGIPGAVAGLVLFAAVMALSQRGSPVLAATRRIVTPVCRPLLTHMGLLFVPAGVGAITQAELIRRQWAPIAAALVGSTVIALVVTGWLMHRLGRRTAAEP